MRRLAYSAAALAALASIGLAHAEPDHTDVCPPSLEDEACYSAVMPARAYTTSEAFALRNDAREAIYVALPQAEDVLACATLRTTQVDGHTVIMLDLARCQ